VQGGAWLTDAEPISREHADWTSVYSPGPVRARDLRRLARDAGVHVYTNDPDVIVFANQRYVTVCADRNGGPTAIRLLHKATVTDTATAETLCRADTRFTVELRPKEVRVFRLG
jgi:hypothetical protein